MNADQETAIDVAARRRLAEAIRHFAAGQITNVQFDQRIPVTSEAALYEIENLGVWPLYDDVRTHKMTGRWALNPAAKKSLARIILFLRSEQPHAFATRTGPKFSVLWLVASVVIGWTSGSLMLGLFSFFAALMLSSRYGGTRRRREDDEFWPFRTKADYAVALARPVYLRGERT